MMQSQLPRGVAFIFLLFKTKMSENIWLLFFYLNLFKNKKKLNDNRNYNILKVLAHGITLGGEYCFVEKGFLKRVLCRRGKACVLITLKGVTTAWHPP